MRSLTPTQKQIHERTMQLAARHRKVEVELCETLQQAERMKLYKAFEKPSLFVYATEILKLERWTAYMLITVARKAIEVAALKRAISDRTITVARASRIVSALTLDNANELIAFATAHTKDETDFEVARRNPRSQMRQSVKALSEEYVEVKVVMKRSTLEKLKRAEALEAQRQQSIKWGDVMDVALSPISTSEIPFAKPNASRFAKQRLSGSQSARRRRLKRKLAS